MQAGKKFKVKQDRDGDWLIANCSGALGEEAAGILTELASAGPKVRFNLRQVTNVNSNGIAAWIAFMRDFKNGREIILSECSTQFVMQLNMIPLLLEGIGIDSVMMPMACEQCRVEGQKLVHIDSGTPREADLNLEVLCEQCKEPMEPEEDPDDYLAFLAAQ